MRNFTPLGQLPGEFGTKKSVKDVMEERKPISEIITKRKPIKYKPTPLKVSPLDVAKEIPAAAKETAVELGQSWARNVASFINSEALEPVVEPITKKLAEYERISPTFKHFTEELSGRLYGDLTSSEVTELTGETPAEQLAPAGERVVELEDRIQKKGERYKEISKTPTLNARERFITEKMGELYTEHKDKLAPLAIIGYLGLDLVPFGGSTDDLFKAMKRTKGLDEAIDVLRKLGVDDDLAKNFAPDVVKVKSKKEAKDLFDNISNLQLKTTKGVAREAPVRGISRNLAQEARKIKPVSFDEMSSFKGDFERGLKLDRALGAYGAVVEPKNIYKSADNFTPQQLKALSNWYKQRTAIHDNPAQITVYTILDDVISRKLTRRSIPFVEEITTPTKTLPDNLITEARKYESAEEFVKAVKIPDIRRIPEIKKDIRYYEKELPRILKQTGDKMTAKGQRDIEVKLSNLKKELSRLEPIATEIEKRMTPEAKALKETQIKQWARRDATKEFLADFYNQAVKKVKKVAKPKRKVPTEAPKPAVIRGETFTLGERKTTQPTIKELRTELKTEIKATKQELKNTRIAKRKATKLAEKQQKARTQTLDNIQRHTKGKTKNIIKRLKKRNLSNEDINNILLEDGTKLVDTVRVKRNSDGSLATYITKDQINEVKKFYTGKTPEKWIKKYSIQRIGEKTGDLGKIYELPQVYFDRKELYQIYSKLIHEGDRAAEAMKNTFLKRFKDEGLFKKSGWFTADRFKLSRKEANRIGKYYLFRQKKGYKLKYKDLTDKEKRFVDIFDGIIKETEPEFYRVAKKNNKTPGKVKNYAPIMTRDDIELADRAGTMDFIMRKHPAFFSLKQRAKKVPKETYETDYRKVASRWLGGITRFNTTGDVSQDVKYLINSEEFKGIVNEKDWSIINEWLRNTITNPQPVTARGKSVNWLARFLRQKAAYASLGLNYASVAKQALTQIPIAVIGRARPKFKSKFAKAFGINVKELPSLTSRKGNIAIQDLQGRVGRIFTGPLTQFDKGNAQLSLKGLLDKEGMKLVNLKNQGVEVSQETINAVLKKAQDELDLWYGGMVSTGQRPEAFRSELGKFINMFIYPLTSQLNGFYRHIYKAKGWKNAKAIAEVATAATAIAYMEQTISNLSPKWSDEVEMTKDTLVSLAGNIPIIGQIAWSLAMDQELQISAGVSGIETLRRKLVETSKGMAEPDEVGFAIGETFGLPKQFRRFYEGMEIINEGGIRDKTGKMLAPVQEVDEIMRSILRGKYGSMAAKDWVRNIGEKKENRRWFIKEVEFLQNGDYNRKAELYNEFTIAKQKELRSYLSEGQQKRLDKALKKRAKTFYKVKKPIDEIINRRQPIEAIITR